MDARVWDVKIVGSANMLLFNAKILIKIKIFKRLLGTIHTFK